MNPTLKTSLIVAGTVGTTYLLSEMHDGPALFAGVYSATSIYLMNEWYQDDADYSKLVVPMGLLAMAVTNVSLLSDEDEYKSNEIFVYNLGAISLLTGYYFWEKQSKYVQSFPQQKKWAHQIFPVIGSQTTWIAATLSF